MPPSEWSNICKACKLAGVVLVVDETLTLLWCGELFAFQRAQYVGRPDVVLFGKGLVTAGVALC
jgi:adenosylmethionine-8-amino-7-oxononanoate aminotransferase